MEKEQKKLTAHKLYKTVLFKDTGEVMLDEYLIKLKDLSELMMEMSYSAVFLHDKDLAKQVHALYQEFKRDYESAYKKTESLSQHDKSYVQRLLVYMKELATNAVFIADLSEMEKIPTIVKRAFAKTDTRVIHDIIHYSSFFAGKKIGDLNIRTHTKAKIIAVQRNNQWIFTMDKHFQFKAKDYVVAVGSEKSEKLLREAINKSTLLR
jgi:uncharacterized protein with PhoU and TrkA domain